MGAVDYIYKPINPELVTGQSGSVCGIVLGRITNCCSMKQNCSPANRLLQKEIEERKASEEKVQILNAQLVENNAHSESS